MIQSYLNNEEEAAAHGDDDSAFSSVGAPGHRRINSSDGRNSNFSEDIITKKHNKPIKTSKSDDE